VSSVTFADRIHASHGPPPREHAKGRQLSQLHTADNSHIRTADRSSPRPRRKPAHSRPNRYDASRARPTSHTRRGTLHRAAAQGPALGPRGRSTPRVPTRGIVPRAFRADGIGQCRPGARPRRGSRGRRGGAWVEGWGGRESERVSSHRERWPREGGPAYSLAMATRPAVVMPLPSKTSLPGAEKPKVSTPRTFLANLYQPAV